MSVITLAFDIERSGAFHTNDTVAIGASVVDSDFNELGSLFVPMYHRNNTVFEQRCLDEYWSKNQELLDLFEYKGNLSKKDQYRDAITIFHNFRSHWEKYAKDNGKTFVLVSDNNVYDGGYINNLMFDHLAEDPPIPYSALTKKYEIFWETHSMQRGLLIVVDPEFDGSWGLSDRIAKLFDVPETDHVRIEHHPTSDAFTIAYDYQVLMGIRCGSIQRRIATDKDLESLPTPIKPN